jgi:hypothetical protein
MGRPFEIVAASQVGAIPRSARDDDRALPRLPAYRLPAIPIYATILPSVPREARWL